MISVRLCRSVSGVISRNCRGVSNASRYVFITSFAARISFMSSSRNLCSSRNGSKMGTKDAANAQVDSVKDEQLKIMGHAPRHQRQLIQRRKLLLLQLIFQQTFFFSIRDRFPKTMFIAWNLQRLWGLIGLDNDRRVGDSVSFCYFGLVLKLAVDAIPSKLCGRLISELVSSISSASLRTSEEEDRRCLAR